MQILRASEKKKILKQLNVQFGVTKLPYLLLKFGKEKIRAYSGSLSSEELNVLDKNLRIENTGLYLAKQHPEGLRLSLDSLFLFRDQITKNILELNDKEAEKWFKGEDLLLKEDKTFKVLKNNEDLIGCGKSTGEKITNFVPKERRVK